MANKAAYIYSSATLQAQAAGSGRENPTASPVGRVGADIAPYMDLLINGRG